MKDAFDDLERDLRRAVKARRRRRVRRTPVLALAAALVLGGGGAVAATQIARDPDVERQAHAVVAQVFQDTGRTFPCRAGNEEPVLAELPLERSIAATLPALATPVPGVDPEQALRRLRGMASGVILRQTVRTVRLAGGVELDVHVVQGERMAYADPAACMAARLARSAELATGAVREAAERQVRAIPTVHPGRQMLFVMTRVPGERGSFGVGLPAEPGNPLEPGIIGSGGRRYVGLAGPPAARIRIDPGHGRSRTARVVQGFYTFALPRGSGRTQLTEVTATGERIRSFRLPR